MRITLFDWVAGGHHPIYIRRFAEALGSDAAEVIVAAPDETIADVADGSFPTISLGCARPHMPPRRWLGSGARSVLQDEVSLIARVADESRPDHFVHLYADSVLPYLVRAPRIEASVSVLLFYPRAHYPTAFQTPLQLGERLRAAAKETLVSAWRRRKDAHAVLTLDEEAARRWRARRGATAHWIPEPPVPVLEGAPEAERAGCVVYGALAERKGIDLLAAAVAAAPVSVEVTIAGEANASFLPHLEELVDKMRRAGALVHVRAYRHSEAEGLRALARAKCAVLPYPTHDGMSRVLVEACSVGTPVVVHDRGLIGYLVRRYGLGHAVDCRDAAALRRAVLEVIEADNAEYADNLAHFASRFSLDAFENSLATIFGMGNGMRTERARVAGAGDEERH